MAEVGFIKLHRKIRDWEWYSDVNTKAVFLELLLTAKFTDGRFMGEVIPRGSAVCSQPGLAGKLGLSVMQVRTALEHLKESGEITVRQHSKYSVVLLKNYEQYQDEQQADNSQLTGSQQADNSQLTPYKEGKKERRKEGKNSSSRLPTKYEVVDYFRRHGGKEEEGRDFFEKYDEIGWVLDDGSPIKAWRTFADREIKKNKEYEPIKTDMYGNRIIVEDDSI